MNSAQSPLFDTDDEDRASQYVTAQVEGKKVTRVTLCNGDGDLAPHIEIECGETSIHVLLVDEEMVMGVSHHVVTKAQLQDMHEGSLVSQ